MGSSGEPVPPHARMPDSTSRTAAFIGELRRRRVLRVAGVYLVGAWLLIQIADITFTRLGLPDWAVTFVIIMGALLFPVVVALAWVFDLTRSGVQRTAPAVGEGVAGSGAAGTSAPMPAAASDRFHRRITLLLAMLMTLPLVGFGVWWTTMRGTRGADLDNQRLMITPFRVAGATDELGYLREGLMDLVAARIGGGSGELTVVPPRSVSRRIRERFGSPEMDPGRDEALEIAASVGAGLLMEGDVVGTSAGLTVTARLHDVRTGYRIGPTVELEARPDSLHALVDRLATRLVAAESGVRDDRLASITTESMPALLAFLDGQRAFRRGEHERAVRSYDRAVSLDSAFTLAALGLLRAQGWSFSVRAENEDRASDIVRNGLDRLGEADRLYFTALSGTQGPESYRELVMGRLRAAERMPEMAELQFLAADGMLHYGEAVGFPEAIQHATRRFVRTIELDSTYAEPLIHLLGQAVVEDDTAAIRRWSRLIMAVDSTGALGAAVRYARETKLRRDSGALEIALDTLDFHSLSMIGTITWAEPPSSELLRVIGERLEAAVGIEEQNQYGAAGQLYGMQLGRPSLVERSAQALEEAGSEYGASNDLLRALYWLRDLDRARAVEPEVRRRLEAARAEAPPDAPVPFAVTGRLCVIGHLRIAEGDYARALELARELNAARSAERSPLLNGYDRVCSAFLETAAAVYTGTADAARRMEELHSALGDGARRPPFHYHVYDLASITLWEELGRTDRALEAARRRVHMPPYLIWHSELMWQNARLAARNGLRDEAIDAYRRYLLWRENAEGVFRERAETARGELEGLVGEGSLHND